jgi:biotin transport system ATP-binding protein
MTDIRFSGVGHRYGGRQVLSEVDLVITERKVGVIGANGGGKSTLARMINGLVIPSSGTVTVDGLDTAVDGRRVRSRVGFVFTNPDSQIVMPTVAEDVAFSLRRSGLGKAEIGRRVSDILNRFGLADHADHPTHLLSGGQKQLLAIASVLVAGPAVLVADEPTTLLDQRNARMIANLLENLPMQIVMVTHHLELLSGFDRVLVVDDGRIAADGSAEESVAAYQRVLALP